MAREASGNANNPRVTRLGGGGETADLWQSQRSCLPVIFNVPPTSWSAWLIFTRRRHQDCR